jgi:hypothetical protein
VGVSDLDRHQPDIAFEDEIDLRPGRGAVEKCAAVEPPLFQLPEDLAKPLIQDGGGEISYRP